MNQEQIQEYDFSKDSLNPQVIIEHLKAFDNRMDDSQKELALSKAVYGTRFWEYIKDNDRGDRSLISLDHIESNRIKPALAGYLSNLYPRRMKVILGATPYTTGDPKKAELLVNDWFNKPTMRERILSASKQALLYGCAGAKIGYDSQEEGLNRVWMRIFPCWELLLDHDVHDTDDSRFIGHVSFQPKDEICEKYGIDKGINGISRLDFLDSTYSDSRDNQPDEATASSDNESFVRVLEFCNLVDDYYDEDGQRYKGRLEVYVLDQSKEYNLPVYIGPLPLVDGKNQALAHIVPLIFEPEPEYPNRGLSYARQLLPQQVELNVSRSYLVQAGRKDARIYVTPAGALNPEAQNKLSSGIDGTIIEVDEQYARSLDRVVVPVRTSPVSSNIINSMNLAEGDLSQSTTLSPAALGQVTKASASEIMAIEGHTQSEYGRHAEMRDMFLSRLVTLCLAAYTASLYDRGESDGGEFHLDEDGLELDKEEIEEKLEEKSSKNQVDELLGRNDDHDEIDKDVMETMAVAPLEEIPEERQTDEEDRQASKLIVFDFNKDKIEITPEDIDSDFDIGFNEAGRSPLSRMERRNTILSLSGQLLELLNVAGQGKGLISLAAEQLYSSIHEEFELPKNLSIEHLQGLLKDRETDQQIVGQMQEKSAAPPQPPQPTEPTSEPTKEEIIAQIKQMPPDQALQTLGEIFSENPEAASQIEKAKSLPGEQKAQAVQILLTAIEESQ